MIPLEIRRTMIERGTKELSINKQCELLGIHRSGIYYHPAEPNKNDLAIMRRMDEMYLEDPTRGTRRFAADLALEGIDIGRVKVRSLMRIMNIYAIYPKPRTTVIDPAKYKFPYLLRNLQITKNNQAWGIDISYIPMKNGFMYLCAIIDHHSRYLVGWSLSNTMDTDFVLETVRKAIKENGKPEIINSDQGSQFTSDEYVKYIKSLKSVKISMDGKGRATDNAFIERFFRTIKYDCLYLKPADDGLELYKNCKEFINYYNEKRSHSSIGKVPPARIYKEVA
jgi:putative transposase